MFFTDFRQDFISRLFTVSASYRVDGTGCRFMFGNIWHGKALGGEKRKLDFVNFNANNVITVKKSVPWKSRSLVQSRLKNLALPLSVSQSVSRSSELPETVRKSVDNETQTRASGLRGFIRVSVARCRKYGMYTKINMKKGTNKHSVGGKTVHELGAICSVCTGSFSFKFPLSGRPRPILDARLSIKFCSISRGQLP